MLKKEIYYDKSGGEIPVYSANPKEPMGYLSSSNIEDFSRDCVLWGIDGNFEFNVIRRGVPFRTTDHCGTIRIIADDVDPEYLYHYLTWIRSSENLDRQLRANLTNMRKIKIAFPVKVDGNGQPKVLGPGDTGIPPRFELDFELQQKIAQHYRTFEEVKQEIAGRMTRLVAMEIPPLTRGVD